MQRKIAAIWISMILVFSSFFVIDLTFEFIPTAKGVTLYVNTTGSGGAYPKIQYAIDNSSDGDTIFVFNGLYNESLWVDKSIALIGEDNDYTIVDAQENGNVFIIRADGVSISGFKILNCGNERGNAGIHVNYVENCVIENNSYIDCGVYIRGFKLSHYNTHDIPTNNIVNGNPLYYYKNASNIDIDGMPVGQLILVNCTSVEARNLQIFNTSVAIEIAYSSFVNMTNNVVSYSNRGIYLYSTSWSSIKYHNGTGNLDGIYVEDSSNITIDYCHFFNSSFQFGSGFYLSYSEYITIRDCYAYNCEWYGISIFYSPNTTLLNFSTGEEFYGISAYNSPGNNLINCTSKDSTYGINIAQSQNNTLRNCNFSGNNYNFAVDGTNNMFNFYHDIDTTNSIKGKPIYYLIGHRDMEFDESIPMGFFGLVSCDNITVKNHSFYKNGQAILLVNTTNAVVDNIIGNHNRAGALIVRSCYNTIKNSLLEMNYWANIEMVEQSSNNTILNCQIEDNSNQKGGILIEDSYNNHVLHNSLYNNEYGVYIQGSSHDNVISNNVISFNDIYGVYITASLNNKIYHNDFISNSAQAYDDTSYGNHWDNGYPSGGNYWSNYAGVDNLQGPGQDIPGSDGIGDINYSIDVDSVDNYPLMDTYDNMNFLKEGWNLVSIPLIQADENLENVLELMNNTYDAVQWYDPNDFVDHWKHYKIGKPFGLDLHTLNESKSFWIHIKQPGDVVFTYNGTQPLSNQSIQLIKGWNLAGYPTMTIYNRTEGLNNLQFGLEVDTIQWFNAETKTWHFLEEGDSFVPGRGYWVHSKVDAVWDVPL
jgi:parallel beta-helix repeat protein